MSRIQKEDVERAAELARLRLSEAESQAMTADLERMLGYVALLDEVDTEGVEPTSTVIPVATPVRADEPKGELAAERAVANAPARQGTAFAVPKVIDEEGDS